MKIANAYEVRIYRPGFGFAFVYQWKKLNLDVLSVDAKLIPESLQFLSIEIKVLIFIFQILKDEATREQYDYAIAHPEEV